MTEDPFERVTDRDMRFTRFGDRASAFCPECDAPPFRPHADDCPEAE